MSRTATHIAPLLRRSLSADTRGMARARQSLVWVRRWVADAAATLGLGILGVAALAGVFTGWMRFTDGQASAAAAGTELAAELDGWRTTHCQSTPFGCSVCTDPGFPSLAEYVPAGPRRHAWQRLSAELGGPDLIRAGARVCR